MASNIFCPSSSTPIDLSRSSSSSSNSTRHTCPTLHTTLYSLVRGGAHYHALRQLHLLWIVNIVYYYASSLVLPLCAWPASTTEWYAPLATTSACVRRPGGRQPHRHRPYVLILTFSLSACPCFWLPRAYIFILCHCGIQPLYLSNHAMCRCQLHLGTPPPPIHSRLLCPIRSS